MLTPGLFFSSSHRAWRRAVELLSSMRFAIALLVVLAIASVIGTVLNQESPYPNYVNQFGPFWAELFRALGLYSVYSSAWFITILAFLVISLSLCVWRNGPKRIADIRSWKERVRAESLRAFRHHAQWEVTGTREAVTAQLSTLIKQQGYRYITRHTADTTLIAAKRGALNKAGYIFSHLAIIVICLGGLLDSHIPIRLQMWLFDKHPISANAAISQIPSEHRLSTLNPTFRGYAWVPEGQTVATAILNEKDGSLIQDLPFTIQLDKFIVEYYSTGMPKRFASDMVVTDHTTGERIPARVEVNKPFIHRGIAIYQSSFEDGGSTLHVTGYPMSGASARTFALSGQVNSTTPLTAIGDGETIEFTGLRSINVENIVNGAGQEDARGVGRRTLSEALDEHLGSGAKTSKSVNLRNVGPSVQYKVRDKNGQAREFNHYMLPAEIDGERIFLAGMRASSDEPFRYLRIPADRDSSVKEWMQLRAALQDETLRRQAAQRLASNSAKEQNAPQQQPLQESAARVLALFAGVASNRTESEAARVARSNNSAWGGFAAVADFINRSVPAAEQEKAATLLLRLLDGAIWELWQIVREQAHQAPAQNNAANSRFIQSAINALSDSFFYGAPVFLQLDSFEEVKASVFQLTKTPGKTLVYLGSVFLVLGIFAMFYVRERRLWVWLKEAPQDSTNSNEGSSSVSVLLAMSSSRITLDFEKEFAQLRASVAAALDEQSQVGSAT